MRWLNFYEIYYRQDKRSRRFQVGLIVGGKVDVQRVWKWIAPYMPLVRNTLIINCGTSSQYKSGALADCNLQEDTNLIRLPPHPQKKVVLHELGHALLESRDEEQVEQWALAGMKRKMRTWANWTLESRHDKGSFRE